MELLHPLQYLVEMLKLRRQSQARPYHLLLTSTISLTPEVLQSICQSTDGNAFRTYIQAVGVNDRINILKNALNTNEHVEGYHSLAHLIARGYFSTILTTNLDSKLEDALIHEGVSPNTFQTLIVGRDTDERIISSLDLQAPHTRIIKLHGSLNEGILNEGFPDFLALRNGTRQSVQHCLNQDLVVVGSLLWEEDLVREFSRAHDHSIYYATPQEPSDDDEIVKVIKARRYDAKKFVITGPCGTFDGFFTALEGLSENISALTIPDTHILTPPQSPTTPDARAKIISISEDHNQAQQMPELILNRKSSFLMRKNVSLIGRAVTQRKTHKTDILLVTATEVEANAVLHAFELEAGGKVASYFIGDKTYYNLGVVRDVRVTMVQSEMGSVGPNGSLLTIEKAIQALSPSGVIMVGIAFGCDPKKQAIGDILIARQLVEYEQQRVSTSDGGEVEIQSRGNRPLASTLLLDRCISGLKDWPAPPHVHVGPVLSGLKLIDHKDFHEQLRKREPDAIGGEMEGAGLYAAAERNKVDWILVKAICDWGDGNKGHNKDQHQQQAAHNAAQFTLHVLRRGGLTTPDVL